MRKGKKYTGSDAEIAQVTNAVVTDVVKAGGKSYFDNPTRTGRVKEIEQGLTDNYQKRTR